MLKRTALWAMHHTGLLGALRHLRRHSATILTYHGVMPGDDDSYDFLLANFVAAGAFEAQMNWLSSRYTLVPLHRLVDALDGGPELPPRAATVTFDDGFANNYHIAFPILRRLGIPATIFLATEKIGTPGAQLWTERVKRAIYLTPLTTVTLDGTAHALTTNPRREAVARAVLGRLKRLPPAERDRCVLDVEQACGRLQLTAEDGMRFDFMTWRQVREMADAGIEFGSHTVTHPILTTLDSVTLEWEVRESKRVIEEQLGRECYAFAYPNGGAQDFDERAMTALRDAGYRCALSLEGGLVPRNARRYAMDRVNIARDYEKPLYNATLTGVLADMRRSKTRLVRSPG
jgi:peptidoglycan/xylan/chitin deacetylase (PgdA/CDA1 family)